MFNLPVLRFSNLHDGCMLFPKLSKVDKCVRAQCLGALSLICPSGAVFVRVVQHFNR
jgi:hypothetical protein